MNKGSNYIKLNKLFLIVIVFLFGIIIAKLIYVALSPTVDGVDLKAFSDSIVQDRKVNRAHRGTIYDVSGEILAQNITSYTVIAYLAESRTTDLTKPRHVIDKVATAKALSPLIDMSEEDILKLLNNDVYQQELGPGGRDISELKKQQIEALDLAGISFTRGVKRNYPNDNFACYVLGFANKNEDGEIIGKMGIESKYNDELKGTDGFTIYQKDAYGYPMVNTPETKVVAVNGYDIYLTIDYTIQRHLENAILDLKETSLEWATITIADAKTGAIVASASSPSFNPNIMDIEDYNNPLVSYAYEPGSTMKIFSFMAAIENGLYKGDEIYQSGHIMVDGYRIRDWNNTGWGKITYDTGFTYSSNTAAVNLAQRLGIDRLTTFYEKLGFGSKTGIELPGELEGKVELVYKSELASAAFGQGLTTTPIQNIQALTSLTNKGTTLKPYIISKIVDKSTGKVVYQGTRTELNKVASEETINKVISLMDETVNGADNAVTGRRYQTKALTLIGKTGTAQYAKANGEYSSGDQDSIRSFAGVFPKDDPQYIIYFSVKRFAGPSNTFAGIIRSVIESIATYKNIEDREADVDQRKIVKIKNYLNKDKDAVVKELTGLGVIPVVIGNGDKIIKQSPLNDTLIIDSTKVFLLTNGAEYRMPNAIGWNASEIISFANMIKMPYNISRKGKVQSLSINEGEIITSDSFLEITLDNRGVD